MKSEYEYSGSIREMLSIALPMVVSSACDTVMIFTDRLFLSKLGMVQMNASMGGGLSAFFVMAFFVGMLSYSTAMTAQYFGAGDKSKCSLVLSQSVLIALCAYPFLLLLNPFMHKFFAWTGISSEQLYYQKIYYDVIMYGAIISFGRSALAGFFSGIGRTRVVMIASVGAMVMNMLASYTLVFGKFGFASMGIKGAAIGTITGGVFSILVLGFAYFRKSIRGEFGVMSSFRAEFAIIKKLFRFGSPTGVEFFMTIFAFNLLIAVLQSHSETTAAAATIMFNWDFVSFVPLLGVEIGVTSLVGRYIGALRFDIAEKSVRSGLKLGWTFSFFILLLFLLIPGILSDVFRPTGGSGIYDAARPLAIFMLRFAAIYVTVEAVMIVYMGALKGAGDTLWSMIIIVTFHWCVLALMYILLKVIKVGPETAWVATVIMFSILPTILFLRFKTGKWKKLHAV